MRTFKNFLIEASNTDVADVNELLYGYYVGGASWRLFDNSKAAQDQLQAKKDKIGQKKYEEQDDRAMRMSVETLKWAKQNEFRGKVKKIYWTARPGVLQKAVGDTGKVDKGNPTDVLIAFSDGKFLGLSAKSTLKNSDIGFKNPGMGTVEKALNINLSDIKKQSEQEFILKHDLPTSTAARKKAIRADDAIKTEAAILRPSILNAMRDVLIKRLNIMKDGEARDYLLSDWMDASNAIYPYYIKVTGKKSGVAIEDPLKNDKLSALNKGNIKFEQIGNDSVGVTASGKRILKMRFKYESQAIASSMKMSGDPWK